MKQLVFILLIVCLMFGCKPPVNKMLAKEQVSYLSRRAWGARAPVLPMRKHHLERIMAGRYHKPSDSLGGHKDYAQTSCPGNTLYHQLPYLQKVMAGH